VESLRTLSITALARSARVSDVLARKILPAELLSPLFLALILQEKSDVIRKHFSEKEIVSTLSASPAMLLIENVNGKSGPFLEFSKKYPDVFLISATTCDWDLTENLHLTRAGKTYFSRSHLDYRRSGERDQLREKDPQELKPFYDLLRPFCLQPRGRMYGQQELAPPLYKWWRFHSKKKEEVEDSDLTKLIDQPFAPWALPLEKKGF
jgi:hypothetical protein